MRFKELTCSIFTYIVVVLLIFNCIGLDYAFADSAIRTPFSFKQKKQLLLAGLELSVNNPNEFKILFDSNSKIDTGQSDDPERFINYFMAALAVPVENIWVNLAPDEENRILPKSLEKTFLADDLLKVDYLLKLNAAALTDPRTETGKQYWQLKNRLLPDKDIPLNKIWIEPETADVYEKDNRIMLIKNTFLDVKVDSHANYSKEELTIIENVLLPKLKERVNHSEDFSSVRNIFRAILMANWYKKVQGDSKLNRSYSNRSNIKGIDFVSTESKKEVFSAYLKSFEEGHYNFTKKERDVNNSLIKRKYFSGGFRSSSAVISEILNGPKQLESGVANLSYCKFEVNSSSIDSFVGRSRVDDIPKQMDAQLEKFVSPLAYKEYSIFVNWYERQSERNPQAAINMFFNNRHKIYEFLKKLNSNDKEFRFDIKALMTSRNKTYWSIADTFLKLSGLALLSIYRYGNDDDMLLIKDIRTELLEFLKIDIKDLDYSNFNIPKHKRIADLKESLSKGKPVAIISGHDNEDLDSKISANFLAWFLNLINGDNISYFPMIITDYISPDEKFVMGDSVENIEDNLTDNLVHLSDIKEIIDENSENIKWAFVDHNNPDVFAIWLQEKGLKNIDADLVRKNLLRVDDHHSMSKVLYDLDDVSVNIVKVGATASLIAQFMWGVGVNMEENIWVMDMLGAAILRDTALKNSKSFSALDALILEAWGKIEQGMDLPAIIKEQRQVYSDMMKHKLNVHDMSLVAHSDYKLYEYVYATDELGSGLFDKEGNVLNEKFWNDLMQANKEILESKNLPFMLAKIFDYSQDYISVNAEKYVLIENSNITLSWDEKSEILQHIVSTYMGEYMLNSDMADLLKEKDIKYNAVNNGEILVNDYLRFNYKLDVAKGELTIITGNGTELSRKETQPLISNSKAVDAIVKRFNRLNSDTKSVLIPGGVRFHSGDNFDYSVAIDFSSEMDHKNTEYIYKITNINIYKGERNARI